MVEEIAVDLYKIEIPLPNSPLKALNSYVVKSSERNLVIDTGWNQEECMNAMQTGLKTLGVDLRRTDFFITHLHSDHLGLLPALTSDTSSIYFNQPDADRFNSGVRVDAFISFARLNGFPEDELKASILSHPGFRFRAKAGLVFHILKEGDLIRIGDYAFTCLETPGHSWGHMCLYEPHRKILVAGDHILNDISPNIQLWSDEWNPLKAYLSSLDKVYGLDIELVLPGHRGILRNGKERIRELKHHHQERLEEITSILEKGGMNAFEIGSRMSWDIVYDSWDVFPVSQKWFAIGEVLAHLKYLEEEGILRRETQNQTRIYSLSGKS
ncbi:MAG: MBL fold metallo-hydrolase [Deltaproteobacteria bacterium RBG_13_52_11b]|nr:MAG: MBL fold metallo-hydrolase [Deltaproteobacteria bacterium RBG_13_52_11b]